MNINGQVSTNTHTPASVAQSVSRLAFYVAPDFSGLILGLVVKQEASRKAILRRTVTVSSKKEM